MNSSRRRGSMKASRTESRIRPTTPKRSGSSLSPSSPCSNEDFPQRTHDLRELFDACRGS